MPGAPVTAGPAPTRRDLARLVVLLALVGGALWLAGWRLAALVAPWSDLRAYFLPKYDWAAARIAAGELPLWNPLEFGGIPFLATMQPGVFYPPLRLVWAVLAGQVAYDVLFVLHVLFAAVGTLWLARRLGLGSWSSVLAALWVTQPTWLVHIYDHPVFVWAVAWIPVLVLLSRRLLLRPDVRGVVALAAAAAMQATSGYPPYLLATAYVLALGVPAWLVEARRRPAPPSLRATAAALAAAGVLAAMLAAAQLLPTLELLAQTNRVAESSSIQAGLAGFTPQLASLFTFPQPTLGASVAELWRRHGPVLLGLALLAPLLGARRPVTWWALAAVVLCAVFPRGWYRLLPLYDLVRFGQEWRFTAPFPVYLLAAVGLDALVRTTGVSRRVTAVLAVLAVALATAWNWRQVSPYWLRPPRLGAPPVPSWVERACPLDPSRDRVYWLQGQPRAALFRARIPSMGGYEQSLLPRRAAAVAATLGVGNGGTEVTWAERLAAAERLASRAALRCVLAKPSPALRGSSFSRVELRRGLALFVNEQARPRARLVHRTVLASSADAALALAARAPLDAVVLEGDAPRLPPCLHASDGTVTLRSPRPEMVQVDVTTACPAYLVLADTWLPGWRATIDGAPAPIRRADYAFRAVLVPAGDHQIRFRYAPASVRGGIGLSLAGAMACLVLLGVPRRGRGGDQRR